MINEGYTQDQLNEASKKANEKISFLYHLVIYVVINLFLFAINFFTDRSFYWCFIVAFFWGIGLVMQGLSTFVFDGLFRNLKQDLINTELKKIKK